MGAPMMTTEMTLVRNGKKLEIAVEYELQPRDPSVGIMSEGADIQKVLLDEQDITEKLTKSELDWIQQRADRHAQESYYYDEDY